jgi:hypothetical protein
MPKAAKAAQCLSASACRVASDKARDDRHGPGFGDDQKLLIADEPTTALDVTMQAQDPGIAAQVPASGASACRCC